MPHSSPPPAEGSRDPPRRMRVYQLAEELRPATWEDAKKLAVEPLTQEIGCQLYAAVSSIAANMSEGYSRSSGRDRARIFEYALGRSMSWYHAAEPVPGEALTAARLEPLEEMRRMRRMLLAIIPRERGRVMKKYGNQLRLDLV